MGLFSMFRISGSALTAEKLRLDVIAGNLANMNTTRTARGGPYRRRTVVFAEQLDRERSRMQQAGVSHGEPGKGVRVQSIYRDMRDPRLVYDPEHPDADAETGYVAYPNIEVVKEITDLITAQRSYEASSTALKTAKEIYLKALEIGQ
ncbi:MAG: flagellar basal body rod protein FlgC [Firmicutes bacterium]|jgi:flagellar basal-body rod protein FlgC|nr:flagellar basal body rod protein FlgC [Bacillota bacterium]